MKKLLFFILTLSILFSSIGIAAVSAKDIGENINWTLDSNGKLTISGTGDMTDFASPEDLPWHSQRTGIKSIVVESGVTSVGAYAFDSCTKLTSVSLADSVIAIGSYAFSNCKALFDFSLPDSVERIGAHAFEKCLSLKAVTLPSSLRDLGEYAFYGCTAIRDLYVSPGVVTITPYAFAECKTINALSLPGTVEVVKMHAFEGCEGLKSITIPASLTAIGAYSFNNCKTLETIKCSDTLISIGSDAFTNTAYYNNTSNWDNGILYLNKMVIASDPLYSGEITVKDGSEYIASAVFANRSDITAVTVPDSVSYIEPDSFVDCSAVIRCNEASYAANYANDNNITYEYIVVLPEPTFSANGLQLKVSDLEGVAVIRTAYGDYTGEAQIKRGEDARAFTSKSVLKDKNDYYIQYRKEGNVTVSVRYDDGHIVFYNYNVVKKSPKVTKDENTVTFSDIDDFLVIRYAKGEYSSSYDIKRAPDCKNISWKDDPSAESISVELEEGKYTFCVQYKDESYNYYTVSVDSQKPEIYCWGDSLTMGIETGWADIVDVPYPERLEEYTGYDTHNYGVGSDFAYQIAMRQGAVALYADDVTIPSECTPVRITPYFEDGNIAHDFCYNGFAGVNDVEIAGIRGRLTDVNGSVSNHENLNVYFTRNEPGDEVVITEPQRIVTASASTMSENDILILWIGSNDLNEAEDTAFFEYLVEYQQAMIDFVGTDKYLIIGYTSNAYLGTEDYPECADEYNALMKEYWGEHFVDIKEYMATYQALEDFGIEPTDYDHEYLAKGWIPLSFLERNRWSHSNAIHFNQTGYDCVEYLIETQLYELGYIE